MTEYEEEIRIKKLDELIRDRALHAREIELIDVQIYLLTPIVTDIKSARELSKEDKK